MTTTRGGSRHRFRLDLMPEACLTQARSFRESGDEASARSLEAQAARWQHEIDTGEPNLRDRRGIGEAP
jgi:hypothetical protein